MILPDAFKTYINAGMEIAFDDDHVHIRPWYDGQTFGVVGFWNKPALLRFCDVLEHGGLFVDRQVNSEAGEAEEHRCLVNRKLGVIIWQGRNGDYWQGGSGPFVTQFLATDLQIVIQLLREWADTHAIDEEDDGVVWLL